MVWCCSNADDAAATLCICVDIFRITLLGKVFTNGLIVVKVTKDLIPVMMGCKERVCTIVWAAGMCLSRLEVRCVVTSGLSWLIYLFLIVLTSF